MKHYKSGGLGDLYTRADGTLWKEIREDPLRSLLITNLEEIKPVVNAGPFPKILDIGETGYGMEYKPMDNLNELFVLDFDKNRNGSRILPGYVPMNQSSLFFKQLIEDICDILTYLHSNGLVYQDIKQENILFDGDIRLCDIDSIVPQGEIFLRYGTPTTASWNQLQGGPAEFEDDIQGFALMLDDLLIGEPCTTIEPVITFTGNQLSIREAIERSTSYDQERLQHMPQKLGEVIACAIDQKSTTPSLNDFKNAASMLS